MENFGNLGEKVDDLRHSLKKDGLKRQALPNFIYAVIQTYPGRSGVYLLYLYL